MWLPFRTPYRWLPRTTLRNISGIWSDLIGGPVNIIRWTKIIWFDADWDHCFLLDIMEYKFKRMALSFEKNRIITTWPQKYRQLRVCQELCHRLNEDNYMDNAQLVFGQSRAAVLEAIAVQRHDQALLGRLIGKHITSWWD